MLEIMAKLRDPEGGCPWDVEQDFRTIAPYTIEEAYEVADAISKDDMEGLKNELGDLLFQVVFHAQMARELGLFDYDDVADAVSDKKVRRHPHVFADGHVASADAQTAAWEDMKAAERREDADPSVLADVPVALPALTRAEKLQKRAARVGFDWARPDEALDKVREEIAEIEAEAADGARPDAIAEEIGDLLFACANLARKWGVDPETALRHGNEKFEKRFRAMERRFAEQGQQLDATALEVMEEAWQAIKRAEREAAE
ncbi:MAG: nucleoside triphosphate pyrophosphohydrolase [Magnetovibrio sp.]|nr:nucleoside triphosphate pyrophosphohydrolase [Magnetovibrio sp.]